MSLQTGDLFFVANSGSWHLRAVRPAAYSHVCVVYKEDTWARLPKVFQERLSSAGVPPGTTLLYEATGAPVLRDWAASASGGVRIIPVDDKLREYFATEKNVTLGYRTFTASLEERQEFTQVLEETMKDNEAVPFKLEARDALKASCNCPGQRHCSCCYLDEQTDRIHCSSLIGQAFKRAGYLPQDFSYAEYMPQDFLEHSSCWFCCCLCWACPLWLQQSDLAGTKLAQYLSPTVRLSAENFENSTIEKLGKEAVFARYHVQASASPEQTPLVGQ